MTDPTDDRLAEIRERLAAWSGGHVRAFPWRSPPSPFLGLVAEVMLQRTRAGNVVPVYEAFRARYPTADALARADEADLLALMRPLGLLWRVPLLIAMARELVRLGAIPSTLEGLQALPGVGPYVAAAWLGFHGGGRGVLIDANIVRWLARMTGRPFDAETRRKRWLRDLAERLTPREDVKAFNYGLLDFTMTVCRPGRPLCENCPFQPDLCAWGRTHAPGA